MPRLFEKGNPGRPKGAKNHSSRIREDFFDIWQRVDGKEKLAQYVSNNPRALFQFAELIVKLLPPDDRGASLPGPAPKFIFNIGTGKSYEFDTAALMADASGMASTRPPMPL